MKPNDPILLAYLAGVFDGEGYAGVSSYGPGKPKRFAMCVKMTHEETIDLFVASFGGGKQYRDFQHMKNRKDQWAWRVDSRKAWHAYRQMLPYLRIKNTFTPPADLFC
jgi:hypothetical protein